MSNHDLTIANGPGINVRQDIEAALQALGSTFQGSAQPLATYPCQMWADSTNAQLKIRNIANTAWIVLGVLDTANFGHLPLTGGNLAGPGNLSVGGTLGVTGTTTLGAQVSVSGLLALTSAAAGVGHSIASYVAGKGRWVLQLGDGTAEGGGNAGSNFQINNIADDGSTQLGTPLTINRPTGAIIVGGTTAAQIQLNAASGNYRAVVGQTALANRWSILFGDNVAEAGSNAGANFVINRFTDAGALIDSPLSINRASGQVTVTAAVKLPGGNNTMIDGAAGTSRALVGQTAGVNRWNIQLGSPAAEGGSNLGSDFTVARWSDAGVFIDTPLRINRASGNINFDTNTVTVGTTATISATLNLTAAAGTNRQLVATSGANARWLMQLATNSPESGSNAGSDFSLSRYNDAGALIDTPLTINRSNGIVSTAGTFSAGGSVFATNAMVMNGPVANSKQLVGQSAGSNRWLFNMGDGAAETGSDAGSNLNLTAQHDSGLSAGIVYSVVRATQVVSFVKAIVQPSDRRLKTDIAPLGNALAIIGGLEPVYYRRIAEPEGRRQVGLIAQDLRAIFPEVVYETAERSDDGDAILGIDYGKLVPVLISAVQELRAKVATLEGVKRK